VPENLKAGLTHLYGRAVPRDEKEDERPDWVLFNMSNARVQEEWLREQEIGIERSYFNQERVGNCGAASLGLVLGEFVEERRPAPGQLALLLSVGTGLQYAGVFYRF
jgi:3-oxoacyl-[acyl-carrier-protein] synthase III